MTQLSSPPASRLVSAGELAAALRLPAPTPEQAAVVEAPLTPGVVVAGAGSGKTETMAARAVWLVANGLVHPDQVLGLTFTRKAARELGERLRRRLTQLRAYGLTPFGGPDHVVGESGGDCGEPVVVTYDAYAGRIVSEHALRLGREPDARLVTEAVAWQLATRVVRAYDGPMDRVDAAFTTVVDAVLALHGELSGHLVEPVALRVWTRRLLDRLAAIPRAPGQRTAGQLYASVAEARARQEARLQLLPLVEAFREDKRSRELVDFSDQAALAAHLGATFPEVGQLERSRYAVVMLDEYQDTSHAQLVLLRALFGGGHPVTAVGDPCQSIYGWRGASAATLSAFRRHFAAADGAPAPCRTLSTSFRNAEPVLAVANAIATPLRQQGLVVPELTTPGGLGDDVLHGRRGRSAGSSRNGAVGGAASGEVVCALHHSVEDEAADIAERITREWGGGHTELAAGRAKPTVAVLVRRRSQIERIARALHERGLPVEVVGVGGLLTMPEVADVVATLQVLVDPSRGDALVRLLTGARWRIGPRDLDALGRWARRLVDTGGQSSDRRDRSGADGPQPAPSTSAERAVTAETDVVDKRSLCDAVETPPPRGWLSAEGQRRITALSRELRGLRARAAQPLSDLVGDVVTTLGVDVEVSARTGTPGLARVHLDRFLDVTAEFAAAGDEAGLPAFLSYLEAAAAEERGLCPGEVHVDGERVQVLTVHGAKGLEWDVIFVPGMVDKVFPDAPEVAKAWLTDLGELPFPLRGDGDDLPDFDVDRAADQQEVHAAYARFVRACGARERLEERRLAYVAFTRARRLLVCSGYLWDDTIAPRQPGELLLDVRAACLAGAGTVAVWCDPVDTSAGNPLAASRTARTWPEDPLGPRRTQLEAGAALVRAAQERVGSDRADCADEWDRDVGLLLAERRRPPGDATVPVTLPTRLSVSALGQLRRDPSGLARAIRRPVPTRPDPLARRGTAFHAWVEGRYGAPRLLDIDELPGAADANAVPDAQLAALQAAFLASPWAQRQPVEVEAPFELVVAGLLLRGRVDAVFRTPDGALEVVDWKTGPPPTGAGEDSARSVQLAAYRLAWSRLYDVPLERVSAAFHHVADDVTIRPVDLLDEHGLAALVRSVPVADEA